MVLVLAFDFDAIQCPEPQEPFSLAGIYNVCQIISGILKSSRISTL